MAGSAKKVKPCWQEGKQSLWEKAEEGLPSPFSWRSHCWQQSGAGWLILSQGISRRKVCLVRCDSRGWCFINCLIPDLCQFKSLCVSVQNSCSHLSSCEGLLLVTADPLPAKQRPKAPLWFPRRKLREGKQAKNINSPGCAEWISQSCVGKENAVKLSTRFYLGRLIVQGWFARAPRST